MKADCPLLELSGEIINLSLQPDCNLGAVLEPEVLSQAVFGTLTYKNHKVTQVCCFKPFSCEVMSYAKIDGQ